MARFDWLQFLKRHRIEYVTRGQSTSRDNVNVHCPLCGTRDTGFHLGISLKGRGWHCWLNDAHAGRSRTRLIQLLLHCDQDTARKLSGEEDLAYTPANREIGSSLRAKLFKQEIKTVPLRLQSEFKRLTTTGLRVQPFLRYLADRGYQENGIKWLVETYDLHYCTTGPFSSRVIIPIVDEWGKLQTWTGRSVRKDAALRYRALGKTPINELPAALADPQESLLGLRYLWSAPDPAALLVAEGPFDAMWLTYWGRAMGVYATCLFGLNLSEKQMTLLSALESRFPRQYILLDRAASLRSFKLAHSGLRLPIKRLDFAKDPAELTPNEAIQLCISVLK